MKAADRRRKGASLQAGVKMKGRGSPLGKKVPPEIWKTKDDIQWERVD